MNLNQAARVLGIPPTATASEARSAYLAAVAAAKDDYGVESSDFRDRAALLEEAYEAFKSPEQPVSAEASANSTKQERSIGKSIGLTAAIIGGGLLLLTGAFAVASSNDSGSTSASESVPTEESRESAPKPATPTPKPATPTPTRAEPTIDRDGASDLVGSCWRIESGDLGSEAGGMVVKVSCRSQHDVVVSREVRSIDQCSDLYLTSPENGWYLCLREAR